MGFASSIFVLTVIGANCYKASMRVLRKERKEQATVKLMFSDCSIEDQKIVLDPENVVEVVVSIAITGDLYDMSCNDTHLKLGIERGENCAFTASANC